MSMMESEKLLELESGDKMQLRIMSSDVNDGE